MRYCTKCHLTIAACGDCHHCAHTKIATLTARNAVLVEALTEIAKRKGAFSTDPLTHARNCVENMAELARGALSGSLPPSSEKASVEPTVALTWISNDGKPTTCANCCQPWAYGHRCYEKPATSGEEKK